MIKESRSDKAFIATNYIFIWFCTLIVAYPLVYIVSASISDPTAVSTGKMWLYPIDVTFEGFKRVFMYDEVFIGYRNTILYTGLGIITSLLLTLPCAYALSRPDMFGRNVLMKLFVFTMFFEGGLIPTYLLVRDLHMIDTIWAVLLPHGVTVFNLIVTRTFFQHTIPRELEEAAEVDGCSTYGVFFKIVLAISAPIITVMALFYGVFHWNQYFNALLYLSDRQLFPLQLILREILVQQQMSAEMLLEANTEAYTEQVEMASLIKYAVMIVSTLPILAVYPFLQRFFIKGMLIGSVKG